MPGVWVTLYMLCVFLTELLLARLTGDTSPAKLLRLKAKLSNP